jgi:hypothetical protein
VFPFASLQRSLYQAPGLASAVAPYPSLLLPPHA